MRTRQPRRSPIRRRKKKRRMILRQSFRTANCGPLLYKSVMHSYQQANNADKMMAMSQKVLSFDPDDPEALLGVAQVLAERTRETDLDKDQRLAEARKDAQRALVTVETDVPSAGYPPEQLACVQRISEVGSLRDYWERWTSTQKLGPMRKEI